MAIKSFKEKFHVASCQLRPQRAGRPLSQGWLQNLMRLVQEVQGAVLTGKVAVEAPKMFKIAKGREGGVMQYCEVASMLPAWHFMTGHRYKGGPFSYFAFLEEAVRPTNMAPQLVVTHVLPYSEL